MRKPINFDLSNLYPESAGKLAILTGAREIKRASIVAPDDEIVFEHYAHFSITDSSGKSQEIGFELNELQEARVILARLPHDQFFVSSLDKVMAQAQGLLESAIEVGYAEPEIPTASFVPAAA